MREILFSYKKEWNLAIWNNMYKPWAYYASQISQTEKDKNTYDLYVKCKQQQAHRHREQISGSQRQGHGLKKSAIFFFSLNQIILIFKMKYANNRGRILINIETHGTRNSILATIYLNPLFAWIHVQFWLGVWTEREELCWRQASVTTREATSMEQDAVYFPGSARNSIVPSTKILQDRLKGLFWWKPNCEIRVQAVLSPSLGAEEQHTDQGPQHSLPQTSQQLWLAAEKAQSPAEPRRSDAKGRAFTGGLGGVQGVLKSY